MNSINDVVIPPISDYNLFEQFSLDYWKKRLNDKHARLNGVPGQNQLGVDIFGKTTDDKWVGVQCKVKSRGGRLTKKECEEEILKALEFNPKLTEYYLFTTAKRDVALQEYIREKDDEHLKIGKFRVFIMFWDDIKHELVNQDYQYLYYKYYRDHCIRNEYFGNGISKLMSLTIGVGFRQETKYELLLGKLPVRKDEKDFYGINYWKNSYIIVNLNGKRAETFNIPCYESDLEEAFYSKRDRYIISKWINKLGNKIDDVIYGIDESSSFVISDKEYLEFLDIYRN